jgi:hypothetical protein
MARGNPAAAQLPRFLTIRGRARQSALIHDESGALQSRCRISMQGFGLAPGTRLRHVHLFLSHAALKIWAFAAQLPSWAFVRHGYQSSRKLRDYITRDAGLKQALAGSAFLYRGMNFARSLLQGSALTTARAEYCGRSYEVPELQKPLLVRRDGLEISLRVEGITSVIEDLRLREGTERHAA